jgi:hypothetical protein
MIDKVKKLTKLDDFDEKKAALHLMVYQLEDDPEAYLSKPISEKAIKNVTTPVKTRIPSAKEKTLTLLLSGSLLFCCFSSSSMGPENL